MLLPTTFVLFLALTEAFSWSNPILFNGPDPTVGTLRDPCIVSDGGAFYLLYTMYPFSGCDKAPCDSSPGILLWRSEDLAHWSPVQWLVKFADLPDNAPYKGRFWAPEIHLIRGRYYLIFTGDNYVNASYSPNGVNGLYAFVGVAERIEGPYKNITYIPGGACDTTLYWDVDYDTTWAIMPFGDIYAQRIDLHDGPTFGNLTGPRTMIMNSNMNDIHKPSPIYLEGPFVIPVSSKNSSAVILFAAANYNSTLYPGYGYETAVGYSSSLSSLKFAKDPRGAVFWGGHLTVFSGPCNYHWFAYREEEWSQDAGRLCIDPFTINSMGVVVPRGPPSLGNQIC